MKTLLLDQSAWDLVLNSNGDIALASNPYSISQDVASAIKTFLGECYYNTSLGLPYFSDILGENPPLSFVKQQIVNAALSVPEVAQANVAFVSFDGRSLTGQVQVIDTAGQELGVTF